MYLVIQGGGASKVVPTRAALTEDGSGRCGFRLVLVLLPDFEGLQVLPKRSWKSNQLKGER